VVVLVVVVVVVVVVPYRINLDHLHNPDEAVRVVLE